MAYEHSIEVKISWWRFLGMIFVFFVSALVFVVVFSVMGVISFIWSNLTIRNYFATALFLILLGIIALYYFK